MQKSSDVDALRRSVKDWNAGYDRFARTVDLSGADLREAKLFDVHLQRANLSGANLSGAALTAARFDEADLTGAILTGAVISEASFVGANLTGADLSNTWPIGTNFTVADLSDANLSDARLLGVNLSQAKLQRARFTGAHLHETIFADVDLREAIGLETCVHNGPSALDYRTLMRSGPLPLAFLQGCGLPDGMIAYLPSLLGRSFEFYSCFISYSTQDQRFADRLYADLQANGVRCWFAPHDIHGGRKLHEQIDDAIRTYDKLLLILSPASMSSEWVGTEIAKARRRELRDRRRMLFPVRLTDFETLRRWELFDADTGKDSAREIREYFIPDFSCWEAADDEYARAFSRLLADLRPEPAQGPGRVAGAPFPQP